MDALATPPKATCPCCGHAVDPHRLLMDETSGVVTHDGQTARLKPQQFRLFKALADAYPRTLTKDAILGAISTSANPDDWPDIKIVDVAVCYARKLLDPLGLVIATQWGVGYRLELGDGEAASLIRQDYFDKSRNVRSAVDSADIKNVARLRKEGWPPTEIARRLKLTYRAVFRAIEQIDEERRLSRHASEPARFAEAAQ